MLDFTAPYKIWSQQLSTLLTEIKTFKDNESILIKLVISHVRALSTTDLRECLVVSAMMLLGILAWATRLTCWGTVHSDQGMGSKQVMPPILVDSQLKALKSQVFLTHVGLPIKQLGRGHLSILHNFKLTPRSSLKTQLGIPALPSFRINKDPSLSPL
jgi:hypothetical protein